jgi:dimethylamine/trimethylamine dehydrogenase
LAASPARRPCSRKSERGIIDFVGAARPSIADPFLPQKIREGRYDDIRECIGCNLCYANDGLGVPIRCTQNPSMGEEWRRGWHPERVQPIRKRDSVLIVGGGPAGLEAAVTLGRRGVEVTLAEAARDLGGRVNGESRLPGLSAWARVRDWRLTQIEKLSNVSIFRESRLGAEDIAAMEQHKIVLATGSQWRTNGLGRSSPMMIASYDDLRTLTPDDIMTGQRPRGSVVIFDDDGYYMAAVIALLLASEGFPVTYVTAEGTAAAWSSHTSEQIRTHSALIAAGVTIIVNKCVSGLQPGEAELTCVYSGQTRRIACGGFVPVTSRAPNDALWNVLKDAGDLTVHRIGDCKAPGIIAQAVYDGHRFAQEFDLDEAAATARRERVVAG